MAGIISCESGVCFLVLSVSFFLHIWDLIRINICVYVLLVRLDILIAYMCLMYVNKNRIKMHKERGDDMLCYDMI